MNSIGSTKGNSGLRRALAVTGGLAVLAFSALSAFSAPLAHADPVGTPSWGYTTTPTNADGSLDFSGWTSLGLPSGGTQLGSIDFTRNSLSYTVNVNVPDVNWAGEQSLLVANVIVDNTDGETWTYSFDEGSGETSGLWYTDATTGAIASSVNLVPTAFFTESQAGNLAVAIVADGYVDGATTPQLLYSEVLDVSDDGALTHHITVTNVSADTLPAIGFSALLDTMLNYDDGIPIIANGTNSAYIANGSFQLNLDMLSGDNMLAGPWGEGFDGDLSSYVNVNSVATGATLYNGIDSAVSYGLNPADLAANSSTGLAFRETLYAHVETSTVTVKYVDDDAAGAAVTPVAGTVTSYNGVVGTSVGFTQDMAVAGIPTNYVFASLQNVPTFSKTASQTVVVHLKHLVTPSDKTVTSTRTITYVGAGDATPAAVAQVVTWTLATDEVTGATIYTDSSGYPAVATPVIGGFTADTDTVPAVAASVTQTLPADSTVTVTYQPVAVAISAVTGGGVVTGGLAGLGGAAIVLGLGVAVLGLRRKLA